MLKFHYTDSYVNIKESKEIKRLADCTIFLRATKDIHIW